MKKYFLNYFIISLIANITIVYSQKTDNDWELLNPKPSALTANTVCFLNDQTGFILNDKQILSTADCGSNWTIQKEIISGTNMAFKDNFGYVIGSNVVYKSNYMGAEWHLLNTNFTDDFTGLTVISKDTVYITGINKLYVSFDSGNSWSIFNATNNTITCSFFTSSLSGFIGCSNGSVYKTTDGGNTWILKRSVNYIPADIHQIYFIDSKTGFISMGHSTILKTSDGGETWIELSNKIDQINKFNFIDERNGFMVGSHGVIFKTINGGNSWEWCGFQNGRVYATDLYEIYFIDNLTGFAVGMQGRIIKTTNGGNTWNEYATTHNNIKQLKFISDSVAYALDGNSFFKTTNGGQNWLKIGAPVPMGNTNQFDFVNENIVYCIADGAMVYKTVNGGNTWSSTNNGSSIIDENLYSIEFIDENVGFVSGGYNRIATFKTTNGGNTWTQINDYQFGQMQFINSNVGYARTAGYNYYEKIYNTKPLTNGVLYPFK